CAREGLPYYYAMDYW
nr:immunoglobulin heavy chain junction region [Mus musculus]MBK4197317.1 immunoglobulin heavy chain junction region [Mus musculus]